MKPETGLLLLLLYLPPASNCAFVTASSMRMSLLFPDTHPFLSKYSSTGTVSASKKWYNFCSYVKFDYFGTVLILLSGVSGFLPKCA